MRGAAISLAATVVLAACTGGGPTAPTASPPSGPVPTIPPTGPVATPSSAPSPTGSPTSSPTAAPVDLDVPQDAPTSVDDAPSLAGIARGELEALAPPGARVTASVTDGDPPERIAVVWVRGNDPFDAERGFVLWRSSDPAVSWTAVYAFTDGRRSGVLGIAEPERGDLTGDGVVDYLTFESTGGSGACGTARVIAPSPDGADEIFRREACDTEIAIVRDHLEVREAVYGPDDAHCCPSGSRTTTLEWNGRRFVATEVTETSAS